MNNFKILIAWFLGFGFLLGFLITFTLKMWLVIPIYFVLMFTTTPILYKLLSQKININFSLRWRILLVLVLVPASFFIASFYSLIDGKSTLSKTTQFFADDGSASYMYPSLYWPVGKSGYDDTSKNPGIANDKMIFNVFDLRKGVRAGFGGQLAPFGSPFRLWLEKIFESRQRVKFDYRDLVVFNKEVQKDDMRVFIQRIIAKSGDKVRLENGYVYVNGERIDEPYLWKSDSTFEGTLYAETANTKPKFIKNCGEIIVPAKNLFVLGDNRLLSYDSRDFGTISEDDVLGYLPFSYQKTFEKYWSSDKDISPVSDDDLSTLVDKLNESGLNVKAVDFTNSLSSSYLQKVIEFNDSAYNPQSIELQNISQELILKGLVGLTHIDGLHDLDSLTHYILVIQSGAEKIKIKKIGLSTYSSPANDCHKQGILVTYFK